MGKAYSQELRQKVIDEYYAGGISMRNLAKKHSVSKTWVYKLLKVEKRKRITEERQAKRHLQIVKNHTNEED
ncbi:MAG: IS630 transposase-related protein [Cyanobacteriota bacterium]|nr:IS630 transposase-related protein [Cyanobacteriota bacterium]